MTAMMIMNILLFSLVAATDEDATKTQDLTMLAPKMNADALSKLLHHFVDDELLIRDIEALFNKLTFARRSQSTEEMLELIAQSFDDQIVEIENALIANRDNVKKGFAQQPVDQLPYRAPNECCRLNNQDLSFSSLHGTWINDTISCDILQPNNAKFKYYPPNDFIALMQHNLMAAPQRWQYFMSLYGVHIEYPAHRFHDALMSCMQAERLTHRSAFVRSALPYEKRVVIVADYGASLDGIQLDTVKEAVIAILSALSDIDRVSIVGVDGNEATALHIPCVDSFDKHLLLAASQENKDALINAVNKWRTTGDNSTNHSLAFERAYLLLSAADKRAREKHAQRHNNMKYAEPATFIFYVSKGLLTDLSDAAKVMNTIIRQRIISNLTNVQINTIALLPNYKVPLWETIFLSDIAGDKFTKYQAHYDELVAHWLKTHAHSTLIGTALVVNGSDVHSALTLYDLYMSLRRNEASKELKYRELISKSAPILDTTASINSPFAQQRSTPIVSFSTPVWQNDYFIGVVGADADLAEILAHATTKHRKLNINNARTRVILTDANDRILLHPWLSAPMSHVFYLPQIENWIEEDAERRTIENEKILKCQSERDGKNLTVVYQRKKLASLDFYIVVAEDFDSLPNSSSINEETIDDIITKPTNAFCLSMQQCIYHQSVNEFSNVDRRQKIDLCQLADQPVTYESGAIYLTASALGAAFSKMRARLSLEQNWREHWTYLSDVNNLIQNTGFKNDVKIETCTLCAIVPHWRRLNKVSNHAENIIRRYITLRDSTTLIYPAQSVKLEYKPTENHWYQSAIDNIGDIQLSRPFIDQTGAGYVVTLSKAIKTLSGDILGVAAIDVPMSFLSRLLANRMPDCSKSSKRCVIFDHHAYVIARGDRDNESPAGNNDAEPMTSKTASMISNEPPEGQHLAHLEPTLMVSLLQQETLVHKRQCTRPDSNTIYRFYIVNETALDAAYTIMGKARCAHIQLSAVPNSNVHLATMNDDCEGIQSYSGTFCPCSIADTRCLLCTRIDAKECECPCQCVDGKSLIAGVKCDEQRSTSTICTQMMIDPIRMVSHERVGADQLPNCHKKTCASRSTLTACAGIVGCEWCAKDLYGRKILAKPYCSEVEKCFNGMRGRRASIGASLFAGSGRYEFDHNLHADVDMGAIGAPLGPVAAIIIGIFIFMLLAVYAYRRQVQRLVNSRFNNPMIRLHLFSNYKYEGNDDFHFDCDGLGDRRNGSVLAVDSQILLASFERETPAVAVQVNRTTKTTTSSDHGYSTMNAEENSDRGTSIDQSIRGGLRSQRPKSCHIGSVAALMDRSLKQMMRADVIRETTDDSTSFVRSSSASSLYSATTASSHQAKNDVTLTTLVHDDTLPDCTVDVPLCQSERRHSADNQLTVTAMVHHSAV